MLPFAFRLAIGGLLLVALGPVGNRLGLWRFTVGLPLMGLGVLVALVSLLIAVVGGLRSGEWAQATVAMAVGLLAVAVPASQLLKGFGAPAIHDISTDMQEPPSFQAVVPLRTGDVSPADYDGDTTAAQQRAAYGDIGPVRLPVSPGQAFTRALQASRELGWTVVASDPAAGRIEATDTTYWFGFIDDVVIRVRAEGEASRIDVRSKSRVGRSDLGANARRIRAFISNLSAPWPHR